MQAACFRLLVLLALCLLPAGLLSAQTREEAQEALNILQKVLDGTYSNRPLGETLYDRVTDDQIQEFLLKLGFNDFRRLNSDDRGSYFAVKMHERNVLVINYRDSHDLQLHTVITSPGGITAKKLYLANEWNQRKRFAKCYLDKDGDFVLEADLDLQAGQSEQSILAFMTLFNKIAEDNARFIQQGSSK